MAGMTRRKKATWFVRFLVVVVAAVAYIFALPSAFGLDSSSSSSSYGYSYAYAYGQDKVAICHMGQTLMIPMPALAGHLGHGDTIGPCR